MADKTWFQKYWWIFLIVIVVIVIGVGFFSMLSPAKMLSSGGNLGYYGESYDSRAPGIIAPVSNQDFAPDIEERQLIKTSSISMETKRGQFEDVQSNVKNILSSSGAYILSENFQILGKGSQTYHTNTFQIKIETAKYDSVVAQLKSLGGVTAFSETATDVTGAIANKQVELAAEKERLKRYEQLVGTSANLNDKITLTDRIFEQDRRIKYLEAAIQGTQQQVAYSTISLRLQEKEPALFGVTLVGIGALFKTLVESFNALLYFLAAVLPWVIGFGVIFLLIRWIRHWHKK